MATFRNGNQQVAFRNGVKQVAYRNGELVMGGGIPSNEYTLSSDTLTTVSGFIQGVVGDLQPRIFENSTIILCSTNTAQSPATIFGVDPDPEGGDGVISLTRLDTMTVYLMPLVGPQATSPELIFTPADDGTDIPLLIERYDDVVIVNSTLVAGGTLLVGYFLGSFGTLDPDALWQGRNCAQLTSSDIATQWDFRISGGTSPAYFHRIVITGPGVNLTLFEADALIFQQEWYWPNTGQAMTSGQTYAVTFYRFP